MKQATIVYDRYHMQARFGKEVLGVVRLDEARKHKQIAENILAEIGWNDWFKAAEESNIPALVRFAKIKFTRLPGLIAHATFPISTGKLEGFNNKIKVAKRIGYGYRNEDYFFKLIRFLSLPSSKYDFPSFP